MKPGSNRPCSLSVEGRRGNWNGGSGKFITLVALGSPNHQVKRHREEQGQKGDEVEGDGEGDQGVEWGHPQGVVSHGEVLTHKPLGEVKAVG